MKADSTLLRIFFKQSKSILQQSFYIHLRNMNGHCTCFGFTEIQQLVDNVQQLTTVLINVIQFLLYRSTFQIALSQKFLQRSQYQTQRSTQLMRHIHVKTYFLLTDFFYLVSFYLFDPDLHLHFGTGNKEIDHKDEKPYRKEDEKCLCPPSLIPHRNDMHKKFSGRLTPLSIVVTCLHLEYILTGREIGITCPCKGNMAGVVPLGFKAFQFVNELVPFASQIVDNGKPDIKKFLIGRERHTQHPPLLVLIITYPFTFHIRNHLI